MAKKRRLFPFWIMPGSYGLKGKTRQRAEAEYYYEGEELERLIVDIDYEAGSSTHRLWHLNLDRKYNKIDDYQLAVGMIKINTVEGSIDQKSALLSTDNQYGKINDYQYFTERAKLNTTEGSTERKLALLDIDRQYQKIDDYQYFTERTKHNTVEGSTERKLALLEIDKQYQKIDEYQYQVNRIKITTPEDSIEQKLMLLEVEKDHNKIKSHEYEKQKATLKDEPYVGVINTDYNAQLGINGLYMELDWNDQFIKMLLDQGYSGYTDENIVNSWFEAVCQAITDDEQPEEYPDMTSSSSKVRIFRREDGKTEVS